MMSGKQPGAELLGCIVAGARTLGMALVLSVMLQPVTSDAAVLGDSGRVPVILNLVGPAEVLIDGRWQRLRTGDELLPGQYLRTGSDDLVWLSLDLGNSVTINPDTIIGYRLLQDRPLVELLHGRLRVHMHQPRSLSVLTVSYYFPRLPVGHYNLTEHQVLWEWQPRGLTYLWRSGHIVTITPNRTYDFPSPMKRSPLEPAVRGLPSAGPPAGLTGAATRPPVPRAIPLAQWHDLWSESGSFARRLLRARVAAGFTVAGAISLLLGCILGRWAYAIWNGRRLTRVRGALVAALDNPSIMYEPYRQNERSGQNLAEEALVQRINMVQSLIYEARSALLQRDLQQLLTLSLPSQIQLFTDITPSLSKAQHRYLTVLVGEMGLIARAEALERSRLWWRHRTGGRLLSLLTSRS